MIKIENWFKKFIVVVLVVLGIAPCVYPSYDTYKELLKECVKVKKRHGLPRLAVFQPVFFDCNVNDVAQRVDATNAHGYLDLSSLGITPLGLEALAPVLEFFANHCSEKIKLLNLSNNNVAVIPEKFIKVLPLLEGIDISENCWFKDHDDATTIKIYGQIINKFPRLRLVVWDGDILLYDSGTGNWETMARKTVDPNFVQEIPNFVQEIPNDDNDNDDQAEPTSPELSFPSQ